MSANRKASIWTPEQDAILTAEWPDANVSIIALGQKIGHDERAVEYRARDVLKLGGRGRPKTSWTQERCEKLKALWPRKDLGTREIAQMIGGVTKNAVIGQAGRMGLPRRAAPPVQKIARNRAGPKAAKKPAKVVAPLPVLQTIAAGLKAPEVKRDPYAGIGFNRKSAGPNLIIAGNGAVLEKPDGRPSPAAPPKASAWAPLPGSTPVRLVDRAPFQCRWPIETEHADHHMCGLYAPGDRYCTAHEARALAPFQPRPLKASDLEIRRRRAA